MQPAQISGTKPSCAAADRNLETVVNMEKHKLTSEERWKLADLTDSFIFYKVMTDYPDLCRRLLERLLHLSIEKIELAGEKTMEIDVQEKGIQLDVYVKDMSRVFDVEMQVKNTKELPERARYYQGIIDVDQLKSGQPYRDLKDTHIIFICTDDIFGSGLAHYTFENLCLENPATKLGDRGIKHFFAAENYDKIEDDDELRNVLKMLKTGKAEDFYTRELQTCTLQEKQSAQTRRQYMEWARALNYAREDGYDNGLHQKALEDAENFLRENVSPEVIARCTGLSLAEVEEIKNTLTCEK